MCFLAFNLSSLNFLNSPDFGCLIGLNCDSRLKFNTRNLILRRICTQDLPCCEVGGGAPGLGDYQIHFDPLQVFAVDRILLFGETQ